MRHHANMMWICLGLVALGILAAAAGFGSAYLLIAVPCMAMMVAMVWMVVRGVGRSGPGNRER